MKRTKAAIYLCTALLLSAAPGCGTSGDGTAASAAVETDDKDSAKDTEKTDNDNYDKSTADSDTPSETNMPEDNASQQNSDTAGNTPMTEETISGSVKSIGDNSIVLSKAEVTPDGEMTMLAEDGPNEELVTVRFSENTKFVVATVKNSGVNGDSDVESREGSFSDLTEQSLLDLTGSYEGDEFLANQVILYIFV